VSTVTHTALPVTDERGAGARVLLQVFAISLFVFPSDAVIKPIGASAYVAGLVALFAFAVWVTLTALGSRAFEHVHHPLGVPLAALWVASLVSYVLLNRHHQTEVEVLSADRWLLELAAITGIVLVAAEGLRTVDDCRRVVRALVAGGAFCGLVAALQYWVAIDLTPSLRALPGFSINADNPSIGSRDALARVAGTAIHPIELSVVAGMLLPLALYLALHDTGRRPVMRWAPVCCILAAIPVAVSRSGVISVAVAMGVFIVLLPPIRRLTALALVPVGAVLVFMAAPGVIRTLTDYFLAGNSDRSIATRTDDVPLVERLVSQAPIFGRGGGTYIVADALQILDNQYFKVVVELGFVGLCALLAYFLVPLVAARAIRRSATDEDVRALTGALAGAAAAAVVCSLTFDSLSFPMFTGVQSLVVGLLACLWRLEVPERPPKGVR
jgi:O-antigen ligase